MYGRTYFSAVAAMLAALILADTANGGPVNAQEQPSFTREEQTVINRNASLAEMSKTDPWTLRRLLDTLEKAQRSGSDQLPPSSGEGNADPDHQLERASPEAVHDLLQLLKQAGEKKADKPK